MCVVAQGLIAASCDPIKFVAPPKLAQLRNHTVQTHVRRAYMRETQIRTSRGAAGGHLAAQQTCWQPASPTKHDTMRRAKDRLLSGFADDIYNRTYVFDGPNTFSLLCHEGIPSGFIIMESVLGLPNSIELWAVIELVTSSYAYLVASHVSGST